MYNDQQHEHSSNNIYEGESLDDNENENGTKADGDDNYGDDEHDHKDSNNEEDE